MAEVISFEIRNRQSLTTQVKVMSAAAIRDGPANITDYY